MPILRRGLSADGAFGPAYDDQTHYFSWVQDASQHLLVSNRYDLPTSPHDLLHPVLATSGLIHRATSLGVVESYVLWLPVAWALVIFAVWRYAGRFLGTGWARTAASAIALLWVPPAAAIADWTHWQDVHWLATGYDSTTLTWTRGAYPGILAGALLPLALLGVERCRRSSSRARVAGVAALALLASWIHPWQGVLLIVIVVVAEGVTILRTRTWRPVPAVVVGAALVPLVYWAMLPRLDSFWSGAQLVGRATIPLTLAILIIAPLAVPAAGAYRRLPSDWGEIALRAWPAAAVVLALIPGSSPTHYLLMLPLPLGVLAVRGLAAIRPRSPAKALAMAALALLAVPGAVWLADREAGVDGFSLDRLGRGERAALESLAKEPRSGGVIASSEAVASMVPFRTGHPTYASNDVWATDAGRRAQRIAELFGGTMPGRDIRAFLRETRARFLVADCARGTAQLETALPRGSTRRTWGCVRLYSLPAA
ncbi:MAG TPA: hypothetical protein VGN78_03040 [Solirubrobacteraceae bacterium]|nr:hypothetical protein [Solirubrobacteraceae bacterium]